MGRILLGGIVAGIVVFLWGALSHMVLPLGSAGVKSLPGEAAVMRALRQEIRYPGLYIFPGMEELETKGLTPEQRQAAMEAWTSKYRQGPTGILVVNTAGGEPMSPRQLGGELFSDILAGIVAAMLVSMAGLGLSSLFARAFFVALLGLFAALSIQTSYWIWYGFPTDYTVAQFVDQTVGWFLGGLALGLIVKRS